MHTHTHTIMPTTLCAAHTTRDDYTAILVFDLEDDHTIGTLPIHPYVQETDEIACNYVNKPHKSLKRGISKSFIHSLSLTF